MLPVRYREEIRAPAGVRKSPRNEPAGPERCAMGISFTGWSWVRADRMREAPRVMRRGRVVARLRSSFGSSDPYERSSRER
jgi:hypothetical protein